MKIKFFFEPGNSSSRKFIDAVNDGMNVGGEQKGAGKSNSVEVKGLLSKIVAGVGIGNALTSAFQDFLRPISQILKAFFMLFIIPFSPLFKPLGEALRVIFPALQTLMMEVRDNIAKFVQPSGIANILGIGEGSTVQKPGALTGGEGSLIDGILGWAQKVDTGAIATAVGLALGTLIAMSLGVAALPALIIGVVAAVIIPPMVNFWVTTILGIIEFLWTGVATIYAVLQAQWDSTTQMLSNIWTALIKPKIDSFVAGFVGWIEEMKNGLINGLKSVFNFILSGIFGAINSAISFLKGLGVGPIKPFAGLKTLEIPKLDTGGYIEQTGLAVVHKGETVVPANSSTSVNYSPTYNISGAIDESGFRKMLREHDNEFLSKLRQRTSTGGRYFNA